MNVLSIILYLLLGACAGWLAGKIVRGGGFGLIANIIIGIVGGFLGGWLMSLAHIEKAGLLWELIVAVIGAVVLLLICSLFRKKA
ncbi:MAG: GlsB/YeaQ/YmgE family stress response membrane protein [Bacteroidales bacterium]|nr:GlsB/YeaQ/YmgE family stress response membrane protein [Bacteroidales bacterium]